jgi:transcriptional regulator with XRE-family HTH domain
MIVTRKRTSEIKQQVKQITSFVTPKEVDALVRAYGQNRLASILGVSKVYISRVMNGRSTISEAMYDKILGIIKT